MYDKIFGSNINSDKVFLQTENSSITYKKFTELSNKIANALTQNGLKPGDRVAIQAEKSITQLAVYAATIKAGGVYLPLNTAYTGSELEYFISDARPRIIILDKKSFNLTKKNLPYSPAKFFTLNQDESGSLSDAISAYPTKFSPADRSDEDIAVVMYTSGTTGKAKGAKLCHRNLKTNAEVLEKSWKFTESDVLLHMLPTYHTHGLLVACNLLAMVGGSIIFLPKFNSQDAIRWMPKATAMMGVPTFYTRLLDNPNFTKTVTENIRLFISGSAPMLYETHKEFQIRTGVTILERYGMTETNMSTSNPYSGERKPGTIGKPLAGVEIRITDRKTGKKVKNGKIGQIEQRGNNVFLGYWEMPEKTEEAFTPDGFFKTGDLAFEDEDGYITLVGRDSDMIISGGLNVYPKEVESAIDQLDGVLESAVIGVAHADYGEAVIAFIVCDGKKLDSEKIKTELETRIANFKQPKAYLFLDQLPRNSMGKVQKAALRNEYSSFFLNKKS